MPAPERSRPIPWEDAAAIRDVDADYRQPRQASDIECDHRCHSTKSADPVRVLVRFAHILGVSYTDGVLRYYRRLVDVAMLPQDTG